MRVVFNLAAFQENGEQIVIPIYFCVLLDRGLTKDRLFLVGQAMSLVSISEEASAWTDLGLGDHRLREKHQDQYSSTASPYLGLPLARIMMGRRIRSKRRISGRVQRLCHRRPPACISGQTPRCGATPVPATRHGIISQSERSFH